jgi:hypothetical protein
VLVKKLGKEGYGTIIGDIDPVWKFVNTVTFPPAAPFHYIKGGANGQREKTQKQKA